MKSENVKLQEIKLVGLTARTKNSLEFNPGTGKIAPTLNEYFSNNLASKIEDRKNPGVTYCAYTQYETDENGEYTYFVGEEVNSFDNVDSMFQKIVVPFSDYIKFECGPGEMPKICFEAWQKIWQMSEAELGGKRAYIADFEVYDKRAEDKNNTVFDLYIGVQ